MAKYRLRADHVWTDGRLLTCGTEVGDGTPYRYDVPSTAMEGVDDEGKERVRQLHQDLYGRDPEWPDYPADMTQDEKTVRAEYESEPVSDQQRREKPPEPPTQQGPTGGPAIVPGPAISVQKPSRPTKPNEEQYPKDV